MPADFIPFAQATRSRTGSQSAEFVSHNCPPAKAADSPAPASEVKVQLKRDGERISQIRIECRCGEVIELDCTY